jgi:hypothetical protein
MNVLSRASQNITKTFGNVQFSKNKALYAQLRQKTPLQMEFFDADFFEENKKIIFNLKVSNFFETKNSFRTWANFINVTGLNIDRERFNNLKKLASNA